MPNRAPGIHEVACAKLMVQVVGNERWSRGGSLARVNEVKSAGQGASQTDKIRKQYLPSPQKQGAYTFLSLNLLRLEERCQHTRGFVLLQLGRHIVNCVHDPFNNARSPLLPIATAFDACNGASPAFCTLPS